MVEVFQVLSRIEIIRIYFYGMWFDIPSNANIKYITINADGVVRGWHNRPHVDGNEYWIEISNKEGNGLYLGAVEFLGDWQDSLFELNDHTKQRLMAI